MRVHWVLLLIACEATPMSAVVVDESSSSEGDRTESGTGTSTSTETLADSSSDSLGSGGGTGSGEDVPRYLHYIRRGPYPRLVVEVDYVEGREPYPVAVDGIEEVFAGVLDKPGGVDVVIDQSIPASPEPDRAWSADAMRTLAMNSFDLAVPDDTIKIHVLVLDGHAAGEGSTIFGLAWDHLNIALFRDLYDAACMDALIGALQQPLCEQAEFLVWQHEIGHVIGLVDSGLPMIVDHKTPEGPHDADRNCVMFPEYEGADAIVTLVDRLVAGMPPIAFDQHCLDDIEAVKQP